MFMYTLQMKTVLGLNHTKGRVIIYLGGGGGATKFF